MKIELGQYEMRAAPAKGLLGTVEKSILGAEPVRHRLDGQERMFLKAFLRGLLLALGAEEVEGEVVLHLNCEAGVKAGASLPAVKLADKLMSRTAEPEAPGAAAVDEGAIYARLLAAIREEVGPRVNDLATLVQEIRGPAPSDLIPGEMAELVAWERTPGGDGPMDRAFDEMLAIIEGKASADAVAQLAEMVEALGSDAPSDETAAPGDVAAIKRQFGLMRAQAKKDREEFRANYAALTKRLDALEAASKG